MKMMDVTTSKGGKRFSSNGGEFPYIHMNQNNYAGIGINGKRYKKT
jgi:hypothetical protein